MPTLNRDCITDLTHVPIWNLLSVPIFLVLFYRVTFNTTATLPDVTHTYNFLNFY